MLGRGYVIQSCHHLPQETCQELGLRKTKCKGGRDIKYKQVILECHFKKALSRSRAGKREGWDGETMLQRGD
jgi:hypothetical protein